MRAYFASKGISPGLTDWVLMNLTQDGGTFKWRFDRKALQHLNDTSRQQDLVVSRTKKAKQRSSTAKNRRS